ncbi:unnamed protein product [Schistocephalus solidus]|uniref:Reverse transcriptase domain-containing protein n=1 Tax=Schistocephalus solidus TaxID=70667 RepID=A0A183TCU3_SCHSO|nr:unnamed protein product [Schistocephalus solidus]
MHPRSRRWQLLDYVLVRRRDRQDVLVNKVIHDADGWTDHRLVISQMRLRLQPRRRPQAIKANYGHCIKETAPLLSSDGTTLLKVKSQILKRWAEHVRSILNCSSAISDAAIDQFPQVEKNNDLDLPPSLPETIRAVQQISSDKALGSDVIPPKVCKHGGPQLMAELTTLFYEMTSSSGFQTRDHHPSLQTEEIRQLCDNHRGISLLNIAGKTFARILLNRLNGHLEQGLLPESQCGFRPIYEAERIATAKAKRAAKKSPAPRTNIVDAQACQHALAVNESFAHESVWLDIFRRNAPTIRQFQFIRQILTTLLPTPSPSLLASIPLLAPSLRPHPYTHRLLTPTPQPPPPSPSLPPSPPSALRTLSLTLLNATAHSPHASSWSVTCESIVQRLVNQCLEHQHATEIAASTALTVLTIHSSHGPI